MRCNKAQYLMALLQDGDLSECQERQFQAHMDSCHACREAYLQLSVAASMLVEDSCELKREGLSTDFAASLSSALHEEVIRRPSSPAAYLDSLCEAIFPKKVRACLRVATSAAALAALWFVIVHFALPSQSSAARSLQCHFGHLTSFNTKASSDHRVFASLSERSSLDRDSSREVRLK